MKYFVIFLIFFCSLVVLPGHSQNTPDTQSDHISTSKQENTTQQNLINDNGIYTKTRLPTSMLALGKNVQIVFPITESMIGNSTKIAVRHQILQTQGDNFDSKNYTEFSLGSLDSREISFPFYPQDLGGFFLQQEISYRDDNGFMLGSTESMMKFDVVDKFSKAVGEDGLCRKSGLTSLSKPDFSTNVCVTQQTYSKLIERGWGKDYTPDSKIITTKDNDSLLSIKKGESFVVKFDSNYSWRISIDNQTVVDNDYSDIRYSGSQGVYKGHNSGQTKLTGIGDPTCMSLDPPCKSPSILFQMDVKVK